MIVYAIFAFFLFIGFVLYFVFEHTRYRTAKMLSQELGGRAVFRLGRPYMRRNLDGAEERAWIEPDEDMAWGSLLSALKPPSGTLFLQRKWDSGFRFDIEPKTGVLFRPISLGPLKEAAFNVPQLDECLRLRTDNHTEAAVYFFSPARQQALMSLFLAGFIRVRSGHGAVLATMKDIFDKDLRPKKINLYFKHLREF